MARARAAFAGMKTWEDWREVHQPFELNHWTTTGIEWSKDERVFREWWGMIFDFIGVQGKCLDVGCGPRPPFGRGSTAIEPLASKYRKLVPAKWWKGVKAYCVPAEERQDIGPFDTVMCWNCLDHTIGWKDILANLRFYARGKVAIATDFNPPAPGHPGFGRDEFFSELDRHFKDFKFVKFAENFQDRAVAMVLER